MVRSGRRCRDSERFSSIIALSAQPLAAMSVFNSPALGFSP